MVQFGSREDSGGQGAQFGETYHKKRLSFARQRIPYGTPSYGNHWTNLDRDGHGAGPHTARRLSAHGGHGLAQYTYANVFRYGSDLVAPDNVQAYLWYSQALSAHIVYIFEIPRKRDAIAVQMTEEEIAEAERLLAGWEPVPCEPETA